MAKLDQQSTIPAPVKAFNDGVVRVKPPIKRYTMDEVALAQDHVPDKSSMGHGYTQWYERHFSQLRDREIKLLEIGVGDGPSMRMWSTYFPNARITGADIDITRCAQPLPDRVQLWEMNQSSKISLANMANYLAPWDIIVDDGSHNPADQVLSFQVLWRYLNDGGWYVVEDLQTSYTVYSTMMPSFIEWIYTLIGDVNARGKLTVAGRGNNPVVELARLDGREDDIDEIHLYRYVIMVHKRVRFEEAPFST